MLKYSTVEYMPKIIEVVCVVGVVIKRYYYVDGFR